MGSRPIARFLATAAFAVTFGLGGAFYTNNANAASFELASAIIPDSSITVPFQVYNDGGIDASGFMAELTVGTFTGTVDSSLSGTQWVTFDFEVLSSFGSFADIYFESGFADLFGDDWAIFEGSGVQYTGGIGAGVSPPAPAGSSGFPLSWLGNFAAFEASPNANGLEFGEELQIVFEWDPSITANFDVDDIVDLITAGRDALGTETPYNIAANIHDCDGMGGSCHVVANPLPGTVWLLGSALLGLLGYGAKRRSAAA